MHKFVTPSALAAAKAIEVYRTSQTVARPILTRLPELREYRLEHGKPQVLALEPDQLWEYDRRTPSYYRDRHRDLPPEVAAVVHQAAAATAAKESSSSSAR